MLTISVPCREGDDGSKVESLKSIRTCPVYQDPLILSGISTRKLTDGIIETFVKSWSPTSRLVDECKGVLEEDVQGSAQHFLSGGNMVCKVFHINYAAIVLSSHSS